MTAGQNKQDHAHRRRGDRQAQDALEISKAVVATKASFIAKK